MSQRPLTRQSELVLANPSDCRNLPVRLIDIRPDVRLRAARDVAQRDPWHAHDALHAALFPSATVYYVQESALTTLVKVAA